MCVCVQELRKNLPPLCKAYAEFADTIGQCFSVALASCKKNYSHLYCDKRCDDVYFISVYSNTLTPFLYVPMRSPSAPDTLDRVALKVDKSIAERQIQSLVSRLPTTPQVDSGLIICHFGKFIYYIYVFIEGIFVVAFKAYIYVCAKTIRAHACTYAPAPPV